MPGQQQVLTKRYVNSDLFVEDSAMGYAKTMLLCELMSAHATSFVIY